MFEYALFAPEKDGYVLKRIIRFSNGFWWLYFPSTMNIERLGAYGRHQSVDDAWESMRKAYPHVPWSMARKEVTE